MIFMYIVKWLLLCLSNKKRETASNIYTKQDGRNTLFCSTILLDYIIMWHQRIEHYVLGFMFLLKISSDSKNKKIIDLISELLSTSVYIYYYADTAVLSQFTLGIT